MDFLGAPRIDTAWGCGRAMMGWADGRRGREPFRLRWVWDCLHHCESRWERLALVASTC